MVGAACGGRGFGRTVRGTGVVVSSPLSHASCSSHAQVFKSIRGSDSPFLNEDAFEDKREEVEGVGP